MEVVCITVWFAFNSCSLLDLEEHVWCSRGRTCAAVVCISVPHIDIYCEREVERDKNASLTYILPASDLRPSRECIAVITSVLRFMLCFYFA